MTLMREDGQTRPARWALGCEGSRLEPRKRKWRQGKEEGEVGGQGPFLGRPTSWLSPWGHSACSPSGLVPSWVELEPSGSLAPSPLCISNRGLSQGALGSGAGSHQALVLGWGSWGPSRCRSPQSLESPASGRSGVSPLPAACQQASGLRTGSGSSETLRASRGDGDEAQGSCPPSFSRSVRPFPHFPTAPSPACLAPSLVPRSRLSAARGPGEVGRRGQGPGTLTPAGPTPLHQPQ